MGNPVQAAMLSVGGGFLLATAMVVFSPTLRKRVAKILVNWKGSDLKVWQLFAGVGGGIFIFGQALVVPIYGVAVYIISVVAGQTIFSLVVDKFGIGPAGKKPVTFFRVSAAGLTFVGALLATIGKVQTFDAMLPALMFGFFAGAATSWQYALNGRISTSFRSTLITSSLNFLMGFSFLTVVLVISSVAGLWPMSQLPNILHQPQLWSGGVLGLIFIAGASFFVARLGVLRFAIISVLGQLVGAYLLDVIFPTGDAGNSWLVLLGLAITAFAVLLSSRGSAEDFRTLASRP